MFVVRSRRLALVLMIVLFYKGVAQAWQARPSAAWDPNLCPFFGGWTGGWLGMVMTILLWAVVCLAIIHLMRRLFTSPKTDRPAAYAASRILEILKERYARGEITVEEFQRMKRDLL